MPQLKKAQKLIPTHTGYIETSRDALIILQHVLNGTLLPVMRRPIESERKNLIKSGSIFVFIEESSGIKRWTDGTPWSPSRILGRFLIYRELPKQQHITASSTSSSSQNTTNVEELSASPRPRNTSTQTITAYDMAGGQAVVAGMTRKRSRGDMESTEEPVSPRNTSPTTTTTTTAATSTISENITVFNADGLIKKSMSLSIYPNTQYKKTIHLVSYYRKDDVVNEKLSKPSTDPALCQVEISFDLLEALKNTSLGHAVTNRKVGDADVEIHGFLETDGFDIDTLKRFANEYGEKYAHMNKRRLNVNQTKSYTDRHEYERQQHEIERERNQYQSIPNLFVPQQQQYQSHQPQHLQRASIPPPQHSYSYPLSVHPKHHTQHEYQPPQPPQAYQSNTYTYFGNTNFCNPVYPYTPQPSISSAASGALTTTGNGSGTMNSPSYGYINSPLLSQTVQSSSFGVDEYFNRLPKFRTTSATATGMAMGAVATTNVNLGLNSPLSTARNSVEQRSQSQQGFNDQAEQYQQQPLLFPYTAPQMTQQLSSAHLYDMNGNVNCNGNSAKPHHQSTPNSLANMLPMSSYNGNCQLNRSSGNCTPNINVNVNVTAAQNRTFPQNVYTMNNKTNKLPSYTSNILGGTTSVHGSVNTTPTLTQGHTAPENNVSVNATTVKLETGITEMDTQTTGTGTELLAPALTSSPTSPSKSTTATPATGYPQMVHSTVY